MVRVGENKIDLAPQRMGSLWAARLFRALATWFLLFGIIFMVETGRNGSRNGSDDTIYLVPLFVMMTSIVMFGTSLFTLYAVKTKLIEKTSMREVNRAQTVIKLVVDIVMALVLVTAYHFLSPLLGVDINLSFSISYLFWLCINIVTWLLSGVIKIAPVEGVYTRKAVAFRSVKASVAGAHIGLLLLAWFIFWYLSR